MAAVAAAPPARQARGLGSCTNGIKTRIIFLTFGLEEKKFDPGVSRPALSKLQSLEIRISANFM